MRNYQYILFFLFLALFLVLELTIFSIPFVFILSIVLLSFYRTPLAFIFVLMSGIFLDALRVDNFGFTPIFIFATFLVIHLYESYFGSSDFVVISLITVIATFMYAYILSYSLIGVILMFLLITILFYIFKYLVKKGIL